jgi:cytochrome oxidase Cu insertion factor (SCO1/SenC/PrrC family)
MTQDTFFPVTFDPKTDTITYPDGTKETLLEYQNRKHKFEYIRSLQDALEKLKVLYQNPGCLTEGEYYAAKSDIQGQFDFWECNVFIEYGDGAPSPNN